MELKKLDASFYTNNSHLQEALDNFNGNWQDGKVRGYGVVVITLNNLTFAIPLRTNIRHKAAYITKKCHEPGIQGKGLDFSKSLLITDEEYISEAPFKIPPEEHKKLRSKEFFITSKFEKYVEKYIFAINSRDENIISSLEYRFTTLINYHDELGLPSN
tara:strand:+ start:768 stop:1244 length:477 start_codon:yes stop_codon:yes gene_type:complete